MDPDKREQMRKPWLVLSYLRERLVLFCKRLMGFFRGCGGESHQKTKREIVAEESKKERERESSQGDGKIKAKKRSVCLFFFFSSLFSLIYYIPHSLSLSFCFIKFFRVFESKRTIFS